MKSLNTYYSNFHNLQTFVEENMITNSASLLIQVFTSKNDKNFIQTLLEELSKLLPDAVVVGSTTDGEIMNGMVSTHKTVLSFTQFEHTRLKTYIVEHKQDGYFSGQSMAKELVEDDTKLMITFVDGLNSNGEAFLKGIHSVNSDVKVAGGLAGDNATFMQTYVFTKECIVNNGAVGVALNGTRLKVHTDYSFNWQRIGKQLTITKVENNRVYTIGNRTAEETYKHYLGDSMAKGLPAIGIEFPLILERDGIDIARAVLAKHDDGSLTFAGNFELGDQVQFGYGDPLEILHSSKNILTGMQHRHSEAIFIYSCMARRHFMPDEIDAETLPLQRISPASGFFTYGEFFTSDAKKELLNQSMTIVSLSESTQTKVHNNILSHHTNEITSTSINSLIHLLNVTSEEAMEEMALQKALRRFETIYEKSPDGILLIQNGQLMECNQKLLDIFGYTSEGEFLSANPMTIFSKKQPEGKAFCSYMNKRFKKNKNDKVEGKFKRKNGTFFWAEILLTHINLNDEHITYVVCRDITESHLRKKEKKRQKKILFHQANFDVLTGLPNRAYFSKKMDQYLKESIENKEKLALLFFDLDGFKTINDSLGHDIGDKVLQIIGSRMETNMRKKDFIARFGGDEFVLIIRNVENEDHIIRVAQKILDIVKNPISTGDHILHTSASIGISVSPKDTLDVQSLLKFSDTAMYKAKEEGGNNFQFYMPKMTELIHEDQIMERELREGIHNEDFEVYYQPQMNVITEKVIGFEALIRWNHPILGILTPDIFLPTVKKMGLLVNFDRWVMKTAIEQFSHWYNQGLEPGTLALNMTMKQLEDPHLMEELKSNLELYNFKAKWLEFEVMENEMMTNPSVVIPILKELHDLGISIAIDDFGTGYSSLSHLKQLYIDKLKIDKSFITDLPDKDSKIIINTIITLAKSLQLEVLAEGIETKEQKKFLLSQGCHNMQGYYFNKPLDSEKVKIFLQAVNR